MKFFVAIFYVAMNLEMASAVQIENKICEFLMNRHLVKTSKLAPITSGDYISHENGYYFGVTSEGIYFVRKSFSDYLFPSENNHLRVIGGLDAKIQGRFVAAVVGNPLENTQQIAVYDRDKGSLLSLFSVDTVISQAYILDEKISTSYRVSFLVLETSRNEVVLVKLSAEPLIEQMLIFDDLVSTHLVPAIISNTESVGILVRQSTRNHPTKIKQVLVTVENGSFVTTKVTGKYRLKKRGLK